MRPPGRKAPDRGQRRIRKAHGEDGLDIQDKLRDVRQRRNPQDGCGGSQIKVIGWQIHPSGYCVSRDHHRYPQPRSRGLQVLPRAQYSHHRGCCQRIRSHPHRHGQGLHRLHGVHLQQEHTGNGRTGLRVLQEGSIGVNQGLSHEELLPQHLRPAPLLHQEQPDEVHSPGPDRLCAEAGHTGDEDRDHRRQIRALHGMLESADQSDQGARTGDARPRI